MAAHIHSRLKNQTEDGKVCCMLCGVDIEVDDFYYRSAGYVASVHGLRIRCDECGKLK